MYFELVSGIVTGAYIGDDGKFMDLDGRVTFVGVRTLRGYFDWDDVKVGVFEWDDPELDAQAEVVLVQPD